MPQISSKTIETQYYEKYFWDIFQMCKCLSTACIAQMHAHPEIRQLVEGQLLTTFRAEPQKKCGEKPYWVFSHYLVSLIEGKYRGNRVLYLRMSRLG